MLLRCSSLLFEKCSLQIAWRQRRHTLGKKSTSEHLFWCFRLSQIEDSIQYLVGPNSTWKDHARNLGVQLALKGLDLYICIFYIFSDATVESIIVCTKLGEK